MDYNYSQNYSKFIYVYLSLVLNSRGSPTWSKTQQKEREKGGGQSKVSCQSISKFPQEGQVFFSDISLPTLQLLIFHGCLYLLLTFSSLSLLLCEESQPDLISLYLLFFSFFFFFFGSLLFISLSVVNFCYQILKLIPSMLHTKILSLQTSLKPSGLCGVLLKINKQTIRKSMIK